MKSRNAFLSLAALVCAVAVLALTACGQYAPPPTSPDINFNISNQNTNNNGAGQGQGGTGSGSNGPCLTVARVGVKRHGSTDTRASSAAVGTAVTLDATPKDQADNIRPDTCNVASPISWGVAGPCTILDGSSYTPNVRGNAPGTCFVTATVAGVTSNAYELTVTAARTFVEAVGQVEDEPALVPGDFDPSRWVHTLDEAR